MLPRLGPPSVGCGYLKAASSSLYDWSGLTVELWQACAGFQLAQAYVKQLPWRVLGVYDDGVC